MRLPKTTSILKLSNSLDISGCTKFDNLPENQGNVEGLDKLDLSGIPIKELPVRLPKTASILKLSNSLDISRCTKFDNLSKNQGNVEALDKLDLSGTPIKELPLLIGDFASFT